MGTWHVNQPKFKMTILYKKVVLNNVFKAKDESPEMRNWSIFSDNIRYVQHDQATSQNLNIDTLDYRDHKDLYLKLKEEQRETLDIDFGLYPDITKARYLDVYEDIYAEIVYANKFNKNSDLSTTYLGQIGMMRDTKVKAEERFPHHWSRVCFRKTARWHRISNSTETQVLQSHTCQNLTTLQLQNSTCTTQILFQYTQEFNWEMDNMLVYFL